MTVTKEVRLAFLVNGKLRRFIGFRQNATGSLIIPFEKARSRPVHYDSLLDLEGQKYSHAPLIREQHYSVHPSPQLPTENVIHWTQVSEMGEAFGRMAYTRAIKAKTRFAFVHNYLIHSLRDSKPVKSNPKADVANIGSYNPDLFSVIYSLFVADKDRVFVGMADNFNIFQRVIGNYRVVVLWSYIRFPSYPAGVWTHLPTRRLELIPSDEERAIMDTYMNGFDEDACVLLYKISRKSLHDALITMIEDAHPDLVETSKFKETATQSKHAY